MSCRKASASCRGEGLVSCRRPGSTVARCAPHPTPRRERRCCIRWQRYGDYYSWGRPHLRGSLSQHRLRFGIGPASAPPSTCQPGMPGSPGWPQGFRLAGTSLNCGTGRHRHHTAATCLPLPTARRSHGARLRERHACPSSPATSPTPSKAKKGSMASMNRSCSPLPRAVPCRGLVGRNRWAIKTILAAHHPQGPPHCRWKLPRSLQPASLPAA